MAQTRPTAGRPSVGRDPSTPNSGAQAAGPRAQSENSGSRTETGDGTAPESGVVAARKLADQRLRQLVPGQDREH
ncbi:hypothetical protein [Streptomyces sp. 303MFCol5.2]|uniref:hypothetical protein n=1 Tax=Streptomyces sp. 303MFCol5.2 TaxID=1172181 RepID=UPI00037318EF|nr:hypothetical protein [Streptomyces sp. 303MFCol5.2]